MGYSFREAKDHQDFSESLKGKKIPMLVLDQKWHHIFAGMKKPDVISKYEKQVDELLARQGKLAQEVKDLKKLKNTLMKNIVENMDGTQQENFSTKKLVEDRRLIDEINGKLEACEDELLELPRSLRAANGILMNETMKYCYGKLRANAVDIDEIAEWIKNIRVELKKQIIQKQNAEQKNKEIYSYMHDIFGPEIIDIFDLKYEADEEDAP